MVIDAESDVVTDVSDEFFHVTVIVSVVELVPMLLCVAVRLLLLIENLLLPLALEVTESVTLVPLPYCIYPESLVNLVRL